MVAHDRRLAILILRTLGRSQDEVAGLLRCAKQTVGEAERWVRENTTGEALAFPDDLAIRRLVGREFPQLDLEPADLIRAGQVTADDILLHYGRAPRHGAAPGRDAAVLDYTRRLEAHWAKLRLLAGNLREQLSPLPVRVLFSDEVCRMVHEAAESDARLPSPDRWVRVFDAPVTIKAAAGEKGSIQARLLVEDEFLYPRLLSHLQAEFCADRQLESVKSRLARLLRRCLDRARDVTRSCRETAQLPYGRADEAAWLSYHFPAYLCQCAMAHPGGGMAPQLLTDLQPDGSWRLRPAHYPAITIAGGRGGTDIPCRKAFAAEYARIAGLPEWRGMAQELDALEQSAASLQTMLTTGIERGSFRGTCDLCAEFLAPGADASHPAR